LVGTLDGKQTWEFGLYFLYLRNVKGFGWNHKRVYRICWKQQYCVVRSSGNAY